MSTLFGPSYYTEYDLESEGFNSLGTNILIARSCTIIGAENISLGNNVRIDGYCTLTAHDSGFLNIGSHVHIAGYCALLGGDGIELDDFSGLSWGTKVFSRSDDYSGQHLTNPTVPEKYRCNTSGAVKFGKHSIVGTNSVILPNVVIGTGSAVGALSLVTKSLDEWGIYLGVPAKFIKRRSRHLLEFERILETEAKRLNGQSIET